MSQLCFVLALILLALPATAQRLTQSINSNWLFRKDEAHQSAAQVSAVPTGWEKISLPHTWNAADVLDDEPGYYRGVGWYKKTLTVPADWQQRHIFLQFEGANQEAQVYVNGRLAGGALGRLHGLPPAHQPMAKVQRQ